jgi:hypothetical protein
MNQVTYVLFREIPEAVMGRTVERAKMHSDKSNEGFWHNGMPLLAAGAMFSLALQRHDVTPTILFLLLGSGFLLVYFPTFWAIPTTMLKRDRGGRLLWTDQFDRATWRFLPEITQLDI